MLKFKCKRCGACCYSPRLSKKDIKRIKKSGYKAKDFVEDTPIGFYYTKENKKGKCMFLKKKGRITECIIYDARPGICRKYPTRLFNGSCKPEILASDKLFNK